MCKDFAGTRDARTKGMHLPMRVRAFFFLIAGAGCSGNENLDDSGSDAEVDATHDAVDAPHDASMDNVDQGVDGPNGEGGVDAGDGGPTDAASDAALDAACGKHLLDGGINIFAMTCSAYEKYRCGGDTYDISCTCFQDAGVDGGTNNCVCRKNQQLVATVKPSGCPSCSFTMSQVAGQCGIPY